MSQNLQIPGTEGLDRATSFRSGKGKNLSSAGSRRALSDQDPKNDESLPEEWQANKHILLQSSVQYENSEEGDKLMRHAEMFGAQDKFVDYIHHVENAKQQERIRAKEDVQIQIDAISGPAGALAHDKDKKDAAGKTQKDRLRELEMKKDDLEEDLETRDFVGQAKETQPVGIIHSSYACSGSETCQKQRSIKKLFVGSLLEIKDQRERHAQSVAGITGPQFTVKPTLNNVAEQKRTENPYSEKSQTGQSFRPSTTETSFRAPRPNDHVKTLQNREQNNQQTVSEFIKLMEHIQTQKNRPSYFPREQEDENMNSFVSPDKFVQTNPGFAHLFPAGGSQMQMTPQKTISSMKRRALTKSGLQQNNYGQAEEMSSPTQGTFNKRANSQMGNTAPRRRILGGANVYATPQKSGLRNSLQAPADKINMTDARSKSMNQYSNTKSGANLYRRGGILPSISGSTMPQSNEDIETMNRKFEQTALSSMITSENYKQKTLSSYTSSIGVNRYSKQQESANFIIPVSIRPRVPRNWMNCLQEAEDELADVTNIVYEGGVSKGQRNGQGKLLFANGEIYKGNFKAGQREATGLCKFPNGCIYRGAWKEDRPHGLGWLFTPRNELVEGRFEDWKVADGQVKILFANGEFYEGNMKNNQRNSTGEHHYLSGDIYNGDWQNDKRVGLNRITQVDGAKIQCMFIEDKADGNVDMEDKDGNNFRSDQTKEDLDRIQAKKSNRAADKKKAAKRDDEGPKGPQTGAFTNGKLYNLGLITFKNGDNYAGNFKDGRPCGHGLMKYKFSIPSSLGPEAPEESSYEGHWKAGKREGRGCMKWNNCGSVYRGIWKNDMRENGEMRMANGNIFIGGFKNDKFHGMGRLLLSNAGLIFEGLFNQGVCSPVGKLLFANGDIFYGQHKSFSREGEGKFIKFDSSIYEGKWEQDKMHHKGRHVDGKTGDVYIGDWDSNRRNGHGRHLSNAAGTIYDGEWSNDKKQGEGMILNEAGEVSSGEYRADHMEGKLTYQRTLSQKETQRVFTYMMHSHDAFITVTVPSCAKGGAASTQQRGAPMQQLAQQQQKHRRLVNKNKYF